MKVAALITCHNRKEKTLACLAALFRNPLPFGCLLDVFLVDDGSSDGTAMAVSDNYPQVHLIKGDGNLFWNGGMRIALAAAMEKGADYYLWLNDDTLLYPSAIEILIETSRNLLMKRVEGAIVVGSTQDALDGSLTYGGMIRRRKWKATTFTLVTPRDEPVECETMNGNCVLVPNDVALMVGNLEPAFAHAMGDLDYGLRARSAGFSVWAMSGYAGTCSQNDFKASFKDTSLPVTLRLRMMIDPKGLPIRSWRVFTQRHAGYLWPIFWVSPYVKVFFKGLFKK